nr:uncharacterized protein LOC109156702 [Ipomoea trifida]
MPTKSSAPNLHSKDHPPNSLKQDRHHNSETAMEVVSLLGVGLEALESDRIRVVAISKTKPASLICQERGSNEPTCVAKRAKVGETGRKFGSDVDNGIAAVREKLMFDLQKAADKMKDAIFREGLEDEERRRVVTEHHEMRTESGGGNRQEHQDHQHESHRRHYLREVAKAGGESTPMIHSLIFEEQKEDVTGLCLQTAVTEWLVSVSGDDGCRYVRPKNPPQSRGRQLEMNVGRMVALAVGRQRRARMGADRRRTWEAARKIDHRRGLGGAATWR